MSIPEIQKLLDRYLSGECTLEEQKQVEEWLERQKTTDNEWTKLDGSAKQDWLASLYNDINQSIQTRALARVVPIYKRPVFRIAVAASVILILLAGTYFMFFNKSQRDIAETQDKVDNFKNDVAPGGNKAILTLADGSVIVLDSAQNGTLTNQGNTKVIKLDNGQLAYNSAGIKSTEVLFNTISTPRGGQYQVILPDGSKVWLNAASSLRFPAAFVDKERRVDVTGEAYFEVAKNAAMPFVVVVNGAEVQVLGTHFNVMAYDDEATMKTTLLEGSVKFVKGNTSSLLKPGQQSQLTPTGSVNVVNNVDVEQVMAWKNGLFHFEDADIQTIMRQLSRWYDVEVVYQNKTNNDQFVLEMPRSSKLSDVLKVLELTGDIRFGIEGKKIIILP